MKILDFGLSRYDFEDCENITLNGSSENDSKTIRKSSSNNMTAYVGTEKWCAPEQMNGTQN